MKKALVIILLIFLLLASCGTPFETIRQKPTRTQKPSKTPTTAIITNTPTSTKTKTFTPTFTQTFTPTFTETLTPTFTFTPTFTETFTPTSTSTSTITPASGANIYHLYPGSSLKTAISALKEGDTLYVHGGVYNEKISIMQSHVTIIGLDNPVIDFFDVGTWSVLLRLGGNYITMSGFEVRNSDYMGVILSGTNDTVSGFNVHNNGENGILITGDYGIVENSVVWQNAMSNVNRSMTRGGWASGLTAARHPNGAIIRNNTVYANWGEGVSTYEANGTLIENNTVYDNTSANIYISDATNIIVKNNVVYIPETPTITVGARVGIMMGDETYNPPSSDIQIIGNTVTGTRRNFYYWVGTQGGGLKNVLIDGNTFINSSATNNVQISGTENSNVIFSNNIITQDDALPIALIVTCSQITFINNTWSKTPPCQ